MAMFALRFQLGGYVAAVVLSGLSACATPPVPSSPSDSTTEPASPTVTAQDAAAAPAAVIATTPLTPQPIRISIDDLPAPYASESASQSPQVVAVPEEPILLVPDGFVVNVFAEGLDRPRWLALTPEGDVLVTETRENRIRRLRDTNGNGVADEMSVFADSNNGLNIPFGMAFSGDAFFLGNTDAVLRFPYQSGQETLSGRGKQIAELPGDGYRQHWTRNVVLAPSGDRLYVSIGSQSNVDEEPLPRASVQVMNLDGTEQATFASGLRNPVGLDFHPQTGDLFVTVNERDGLGDDLVPDYFTQIQPGEFYGWPYAYLTPELLDPRQQVGDRSKAPQLAAQTQTPDVLFQSHSAALGLQFYDGITFPDKYHNGAFVAFRGSWNRSQGTGYKLVFIPFDESGEALGYYEDFLTGFLIDPSGPTTWGRPVGLLMLPDGSLLFTE
ncbi:MAG: PQQ-dependent sugar dehydrogenase, partial [Leptolyngbyaceae cyanobacterium]